MKNNTDRRTWNDWANEKYANYEYLYFGIVDNDNHNFININYNFDNALSLGYKAAEKWPYRTWKVEIVGVKNNNTEYLEDWMI